MTEKAGTVKFVDLVENVTIQERFDEATSKSTKIILEHKGEKYQPAISIVDEDGEEVANIIYLQVLILVVDRRSTG